MTNVEEIESRLSIKDVVSEYVDGRFKRIGNQWFCLSPLKRENTPSFCVNEGKNMFYDFSVSNGGGVVSFLMSVENLTFKETLKFIKDKWGIGEDVDIDAKEAELFIIYKHYMDYVVSRIDKFKPLRNYLEGRGLWTDRLLEFPLGFDDGGSAKYLGGKGYTHEQLYDACLVNTEGGSYFSNRLIIPMRNVYGKYIGFIGRRIDGDKNKKYLYSKNSKVLNKNRHLFNYYGLRKSKMNKVAVVEGQIDALRLIDKGIDNVVAIGGSSISNNMASMLTKYDVLLMPDNDSAGIESCIKNGKLLARRGCNVQVTVLPSGTDPDEYYKKNDLDSINPIDFLEFLKEYTNPNEIKVFFKTLSSDKLLSDYWKTKAAAYDIDYKEGNDYGVSKNGSFMENLLIALLSVSDLGDEDYRGVWSSVIGNNIVFDDNLQPIYDIWLNYSGDNCLSEISINYPDSRCVNEAIKNIHIYKEHDLQNMYYQSMYLYMNRFFSKQIKDLCQQGITKESLSEIQSSLKKKESVREYMARTL